ncbi:MAG: hypothetical protein M1824_000722 [Vezdaea acicularis]|nr:MAG: hypothetical protein M1824_000722 [Vezdaea acicularis]
MAPARAVSYCKKAAYAHARLGTIKQIARIRNTQAMWTGGKSSMTRRGVVRPFSGVIVLRGIRKGLAMMKLWTPSEPSTKTTAALPAAPTNSQTRIAGLQNIGLPRRPSPFSPIPIRIYDNSLASCTRYVAASQQHIIYGTGADADQDGNWDALSNVEDVKPDGNDTNGDEPDGDEPDGDEPDGDEPDGDEPDGDEPDGDEPDGDEPDGDGPDGDEPDDDEPNTDGPGSDKFDSDEPDNDGPTSDESDRGGGAGS